MGSSKRQILIRLAGVSFGAMAIIVVSSGVGGAQTPALAGYSGSVEAIGAQFGFDIPGLVPLPNENLLEDDLPFSRVTIGDGPVVNSLGAPYYPGDVAANVGSLLATFGVPGHVPNDPLLAEANYPPSPSDPESKTFGLTPKPSTISTSLFSASSTANQSGGEADGTVSDIRLESPSPLATLAGVLDVGNVQSDSKIVVNSTAITTTATTTIAGIDIGGILDISGLTSSAQSTSNGTTATPTAHLQIGAVTVDGLPAYIDGTGVHVDATTATKSLGITPAQAADALSTTLDQDGITISVLNPQMTTDGAEATSDSGGLVISLDHQFDVPYIQGEPTLPALPDLGRVGLPAGLYTATTSITLGFASTDAVGTAVTGDVSGLGNLILPSLGPPTTTTPVVITGPVSALTGSTTPTVVTGTATGPGTEPTPVAIAADQLPLGPLTGLPAPVGWVIVTLALCLIGCYPLLLLARWQFLTRRRR